MTILTVGPNSTYQSIADAMAAAGANDIVQLEAGYTNETAWVTHNGMTFDADSSCTGIVLRLGSGITSVALAGTAPINVFDSAADGNDIVGNDGDNVIHVSGGVDTVSGGLGHDRLVVDYSLATGAVTGDSTSNFTEAGAGGRSVTINGGFEDFTVLTGSGADTITTGAGDDVIQAGDGANTITAGQGANVILGGIDADTITALDGGNIIDAGDGANTVTTGAGVDHIDTGIGADTIISGGGNDYIRVSGGVDSVDAGSGFDLLVVDYSNAVTDVTGGVTSGKLSHGYVGHFDDHAGSTVDLSGVESFRVLTGSGNDVVLTGGGGDQLFSGAGNDTLNAGAGDDEMHGDAGQDQLFGGGGRDALFGGDNNDRLNGGEQQDSLTGGAGADRFQFGSIGDSGTGSSHRDMILDFSHAEHDRIDLRNIDADTTQSGNQGFTLLSGGAFTGLAGELIQTADSHGNTVVSGDVNGDGLADFQIQLAGAPLLISADFLL